MSKKYMLFLVIFAVLGDSSLTLAKSDEKPAEKSAYTKEWVSKYEEAVKDQQGLKKIVDKVVDDLKSAKTRDQILASLNKVNTKEYLKGQSVDYLYVVTGAATCVASSSFSRSVGQNEMFFKDDAGNRVGLATIMRAHNGGGFSGRHVGGSPYVVYISPMVKTLDGGFVVVAEQKVDADHVIETFSDLKKE